MKGNWVTGAAIQRAVKAGNLILQRARQVVDFAVGHLLRRLPCGHATADDRVYDLVGSLETMRMQTGMSTLNSRTTLPMTRWRMPCRRPRPTLLSMMMKMPMRKVMSRLTAKGRMKYCRVMENLTRCGSVSK